MKYAFGIILLLFIVPAARADRALYTSELVESAVLIGVWGADEVEGIGDSIRLRQPERILKGEYEKVAKVDVYSARLNKALRRIDNEGHFILFININNNQADLVGDSGQLHYSPIALKAVQSVISQLELMRRWGKLSLEEKIERSDLIVSGRVDAASTRSRAIKVERVYLGVPPDRLRVLPTLDAPAETEAIFFLQRHNGSGPDYIVMETAPLREAQELLKKIK